MRLLIFSQHFPPETMATGRRACDLAESLASRGHDVTVITGRPNHPASMRLGFCRGALRREQATAGYCICRVPVFRSARPGALRRMLTYATYMLSAAWCGTGHGRADAAIAISPLPTGLAAWLASAWRGVPLIFDLQDIWPDSARAIRVMRGGWLLAALRRVERFFYERCARVVSITEGFRRYLLGLGLAPERLAVIANGVDWQRFEDVVRDTERRAASSIAGKFVVGYTGNLGLAQGLDTVLEAAEKLRGQPIAFLVVGEGVDKCRLVRLARARGLDNVIFVDGVPRDEALRILATCDALLLSLRNDPLFDITIPSKLYEYMAAGKPVLCAVGGEAAAVVTSTGSGLAVPPADGVGLARAVLALRSDPGAARRMGEAGRRCARQLFSRDALMETYAGLILETVGESVPSTARSATKIRNDVAANVREAVAPIRD